jgi:hypothetical protein
MYQARGTVGRGKGEWGCGGGWSVYSQPGTRVDGNSRHDTKEGFPSTNKRGFPRGKGRDFKATKRGYQKGVRGMHLHVYIVLIKDCV